MDVMHNLPAIANPQPVAFMTEGNLRSKRYEVNQDLSSQNSNIEIARLILEGSSPTVLI